MRKLRSQPQCRWLARMLAFLMVASNLLLPPAARAQRTNPTVYVLDFNNETRVGGALLGRVAAAQLSLEMAEGSANWDVLPGANVQRRIQELGLKAPFDRLDRVKIANGIDATAVVYGSVVEARISGGTAPVAEAKIRVLVEDVFSGTLVNGAMAVGRSTPRMGFQGDADVLLEEALGKAAFRAREFMDKFRLPEGTVLNTTVVADDTEALINIGSRHGVRAGMDMIATRQKNEVGRVKVTSVDAEFSNVRVISSPQGIRPEDRVRAVFSFQDFDLRSRSQARTATYTGPSRPSAKSSSVEPVGTVKVAKVERGAEFVPFKAKTEQVADQGVPAPPPVVIDEPEVSRGDSGSGARKIVRNGALRMLVGGMLLLGVLAVGGRGGNAVNRVADIEVFPFQLQIGQATATLRVNWDRPKGINRQQVLQYIVWRTDVNGTPLSIVGASDSEAIRTLFDTEAQRTVNAFDGDPDGSSEAGGRTAVTAAGVTPGLQYRYQIAVAYQASGLQDLDGDGLPDGDIDTQFMSPLSGSSAWATALRPATLSAPLQGELVDLGELNITWNQTPGADEYFIQVSADPNFAKRRTVTFGPYNDEVPVDLGGPSAVTRQVNAQSGALAGARNVFITVGARNSQDQTNPLPRGWIYSAPLSVQAEINPPPPPAGAAGAGAASVRQSKKDRAAAGRRKN